MKNIEIKKVASAKEAVAIINRLNYRSCTFGYRFSTFSNDYATEYRHFDTDDAFAIEEIVQGGKLVAVRFYNLYRDIIVELQLDNVATDEYFYGKFNIINVDAEIEAEEKLAEVEAYKQEIAELKADGYKYIATYQVPELGSVLDYSPAEACYKNFNAMAEFFLLKLHGDRHWIIETVDGIKIAAGKGEAEFCKFATTETDGSEDDSDGEEVFNLLPEISELNDIGENENEPTVTVIPTHEDEPELTAEQIQKLIDATIAERTEAIDAIAEAEADEEISQTHIDYLKGYIDELLDEYNDLCKQLDAAKAKASADETDGSDAQDAAITAEIELANNNNPPPVDKFDEIKSKLQAAVKSCQAEVDRLQNELANANDNLLNAEENLCHFLNEQTNQLNDELKATLADKKIRFNRKDGTPIGALDGSSIYIEAFTEGFDFNHNYKHLATYDTPEQVKAVIALIKEAIERGESEFTFPTVGELNPPPAPEGQPTVQAVAEQLAEINSTAPEGLEIIYDAETKKFPVVSYGGEFPEIYYELDSLALYKILTPEEFWTRIKRGCSTDEEMIEWLENSIAQARGQREDFAADENPDLELLSWLDFEIADREGELAAIKAKMSDNG